MIIVLILSLWVFCGVVSYGALMAFCWHEFEILRSPLEWRRDAGLAMCVAFAGPFGLVVSLVATSIFMHGLMYRFPKDLR